MHHLLPPRLITRRIAPLALMAGLVVAAPAAAQTSAPTIAVDAAQDSVLVTRLPFGFQTVQVTRPDAVTHAPVVIGQYRGFAFAGLPFSVNTTVPTPLNPGGDCWQKGGLSLPGGVGLTPDITAGDTVSVVGGPSVEVTDDAPDGAPGGPIKGCEAVSTWAHNVVAAATQRGPGDELDVSGSAQPLTTGVSLTATDGTHTTAPVDATLAGDGAWTATFPAAQVAALDPGKVSVTGVFTVPDLVTGAEARIAGASLRADLAAGAQPAPAQGGGTGAGPAAPAAPAHRTEPVVRLGGLRARARISLAAARAGRLTASFIVPTGARYVRVRLYRQGHTALVEVLAAGKPGTRQTVRLRGTKLKKLVPGRYTITVGAGATRTQLGTEVVRRRLHIG